MCFLWAPSHPPTTYMTFFRCLKGIFRFICPYPTRGLLPYQKSSGSFPVFPSSKNCIIIHPFHFINQKPRIPSFSLPLPSIQSIFKPCHFIYEITSPWSTPLHLHVPISVQATTVCHVDNCVSFLTGLATPSWFPFQSGPQSDLSKTQTLSYYASLKTLWWPHKTLMMKADTADEAAGTSTSIHVLPHACCSAPLGLLLFPCLALLPPIQGLYTQSSLRLEHYVPLTPPRSFTSKQFWS